MLSIKEYLELLEKNTLEARMQIAVCKEAYPLHYKYLQEVAKVERHKKLC